VRSVKESLVSVGSVGRPCVMPGWIRSRVRGQTGSRSGVMHSSVLERYSAPDRAAGYIAMTKPLDPTSECDSR